MPAYILSVQSESIVSTFHLYTDALWAQLKYSIIMGNTG